MIRDYFSKRLHYHRRSEGKNTRRFNLGCFWIVGFCDEFIVKFFISWCWFIKLGPSRHFWTLESSHVFTLFHDWAVKEVAIRMLFGIFFAISATYFSSRICFLVCLSVPVLSEGLSAWRWYAIRGLSTFPQLSGKMADPSHSNQVSSLPLGESHESFLDKGWSKFIDTAGKIWFDVGLLNSCCVVPLKFSLQNL